VRLRQRAADEPLLLGDQAGVLGLRIADDERPCHVGPASARLVARPDVDLDREAGRERPASRLVPVALPHGRDDRVGRAAGAVLRAGGAQRRTDVFGQQPPAVHAKLAARGRIGARQQLGCRGHRRLGRPQRGADAVELGRRLCSPAQLDGGVVDGQHDPVLPQPVAEREREIAGDDRLLDADLPHRASRGFPLGFGVRHAALDQLPPAEVEEVEQLGIGQRALDALRLERARQHVAPPVDLGEQERVDDRERDLVAQRGGALGVAEQQQPAHARERTPLGSATDESAPTPATAPPVAQGSRWMSSTQWTCSGLGSTAGRSRLTTTGS
jgi:hypothetical protein